MNQPPPPRRLAWSTYVALNAIFDIPEVTAFNLEQVLVENYIFH